MYAKQFEAQHAPHNLVLHMRAGADEIERLRAALEPFAAEADCWPDHHDDEPLVESFPEYDGKITVGACRRARAALRSEAYGEANCEEGE